MSPKLPSLKPREVIKVLEKLGFVFVRQKGSHLIYVKGNIGITIPYHNKETFWWLFFIKWISL
jgi:predicted RNA binding protein YcfA (HicA-like mRNA interferase family)